MSVLGGNIIQQQKRGDGGERKKAERRSEGDYIYLGVIDDAIEPRAACWRSLGDPKEGRADDGSSDAGRLMCRSFVRPSTP